MVTSTMACLRTSRCIFVSPFILGIKSWHLHKCRHCVCCMKFTKRSVQLALNPAHRVFPERNSKFFAGESEKKGISQYESKVTRTLPAVQKGIFERTKVRNFGEGRAEWRISVDTRDGRDWGKFAQREDGACVWFSIQFFPLEGSIYLLSLFILQAFGHGVSRSWILS